jgi:hypothetical protein
VRERKKPDSWKKKVHPAFLEVARIYRDSLRILCGSKSKDASRNSQAVRAQVSQAREELLEHYPELRPGSTWNHVAAASSRFLSKRDIAAGTLEWLCWRRFGQPLSALIAEEKEGSLEAHKRVLRVIDEFWRLLHGQGPLAPFKGHSKHSELMELGLSLGLGTLTDDELADCFDEVCICGKVHDPDALKKQRARVRKQLQRAGYESLCAIPRRQRFAACGAHGITAKAYHWPAKGIRFVEVLHYGNKPECFIYPDGTAIIAENSQFWGRDGLDRLLEAFGVEDLIELFSMFFPDENIALTRT